MDTFDQQYEHFEATMKNYIEGLAPKIREQLEKGRCVPGAIQRRKDTQEIRMDMCSSILELGDTGNAVLRHEPKAIMDFALIVVKRAIGLLDLPCRVCVKTSGISTIGDYDLMNWFLMLDEEGKIEASVTKPKAQPEPEPEAAPCPKSLH